MKQMMCAILWKFYSDITWPHYERVRAMSKKFDEAMEKAGRDPYAITKVLEHFGCCPCYRCIEKEMKKEGELNDE